MLSANSANYRISTTSSYVNADTWFRAVMIAVPVLGLMILVKLVEVAVRLLKSDTSEERRGTAKLVYVSQQVPSACLLMPIHLYSYFILAFYVATMYSQRYR